MKNLFIKTPFLIMNSDFEIYNPSIARSYTCAAFQTLDQSILPVGRVLGYLSGTILGALEVFGHFLGYQGRFDFQASTRKNKFVFLGGITSTSVAITEGVVAFVKSYFKESTYKCDLKNKNALIASSRLTLNLITLLKGTEKSPSAALALSLPHLEKNFEAIYTSLAMGELNPNFSKAASIYLKNYFPKEKILQNAKDIKTSILEVYFKNLEKKEALSAAEKKLAGLWQSIIQRKFAK